MSRRYPVDMRLQYWISACALGFPLLAPDLKGQTDAANRNGTDQYVRAEMQYEQIPGWRLECQFIINLCRTLGMVMPMSR
jgi:hypothetical protein